MGNELIPEYVLNIIQYFNEPELIGKIFKTSEPISHLDACNNLTWEKILTTGNGLGKYFISSTEEDYNKQEGIQLEAIYCPYLTELFKKLNII